MPFSSWLKQQRCSHQLSQTELAKRLDITPSYLSRVESGEKLPSRAVLTRLARLWGMEPNLLCLQAQQIPEDLLQIVADNPLAFQAWCRAQHR